MVANNNIISLINLHIAECCLHGLWWFVFVVCFLKITTNCHLRRVLLHSHPILNQQNENTKKSSVAASAGHDSGDKSGEEGIDDVINGVAAGGGHVHTPKDWGGSSSESEGGRKKSKKEKEEQQKKAIASSDDQEEFFDLEIYQLGNGGPSRKENVCTLCEQPGELINCDGLCLGSYHPKCLGLQALPAEPFKCDECLSGTHTCFVCKKSEANVRKCSVVHCGRFYHEDCIKRFRNARVEDGKIYCPLHACATCTADNPKNPKATKGRLYRCVRCPTAYHIGDYCIAAGSIHLAGFNIVCSRHFQPVKTQSHHSHINVSWCFSCSKGGTLLCCETCPSAFHAECLEIDPPGESEAWYCPGCLSGCKPLYGNIVWVKLGSYRWWPGQICHPRNVPLNIQEKPHQVGEFPLCFFGSKDYFWTHQGRVFIFQDGDKGTRESSGAKGLVKTYQKEDDHPDKPHLLAAINAMTEVAAHINEYKRRKDLVMKYRKEADQNFSDKLGKFNVHSTKKKFSRVTRRMVGISTIDEDFNKEERKFTNLDKAVRSVLKNTVTYLDQLQDAVGSQESVANDIIDYYGDHVSVKEVEQFAHVHNNIAVNFYKEFREEVEVHVVQPLNTLLLMFQGPGKVIKKRHDKLLDYESHIGKTKGLAEGPQLRALKADLQAAKNNYEALNAQLLDELPKLYLMSLEVVQDCVGRLVHAQQKFLTKTLEQMYKLLSLPLVLGVDDSSIVNAFNIAHVAIVDKLSDLSFIPRTFNPRIDEKAPRSRKSLGPKAGSVDDAGLSQSDSQRVYVKQRYSPNKLFQLAQDSPVNQMMDLAFPQGTVVGIIKEGDPMGNKDRWFVDNGATQGFVLKRYLIPAPSGPTSRSSPIPPIAIAPWASSLPPGRSGSPAQPSISPVPPDDLPMTTTLQSMEQPPPANLMDLSSPEPPMLAKATPIPADLDFSMLSNTDQAGPTSTWYEKSFWDEAASSPPSILTADSSRSSTWYAESSGGGGAVHQDERGVDESSAVPHHPKAAEASSVNAGEDYRQPLPQIEDLPPEYADVAHHDNSAECYQAVYPFAARSPTEVSLEGGEVVRVIQTKDLDGNSEWWLVEAIAGQGYAPANYLYKVQ